MAENTAALPRPPFGASDIAYAENFIMNGDLEAAEPILTELVGEFERYRDEHLQPSDSVQYFSFSSVFERLAYRRVEDDPRELVMVPLSADRLYSDLAFAHIRSQDYERACDELAQAVRWNPMNCAYRLQLAAVYKALGRADEWVGLSYSVLSRASEPTQLGGAYANLGIVFSDEGKARAAAGCARLALRYAPEAAQTKRLAERVAREHPELADEDDQALYEAVEQEGVPAGANAEIAVCLLMCASDALERDEKAEAARLTVRARDLVGEKACRALGQLVRESGEGAGSGSGAGGAQASSGEAPDA